MKKAPLIGLGILVAICGVGGYAVKSQQAKLEALKNAPQLAEVKRSDISVKVVDSGTLDAIKVVELRSRASGRLSQLLKDEGDYVRKGDLIAIIDPQETELRVRQDAANLRGAQSGVARQAVDISQRRVTAKAALDQAKSRLVQLEYELQNQPVITSTAIAQAQAALASAQQSRDQLQRSTHPNLVTSTEATKVEAEANFDNARRELKRNQELLAKGYVAGRAVENAQLTLDVAQSRLKAALATVSRVADQIRLESARAQEEVRRAEADLRRARANSIQDNVKREEYKSAMAEVSKAQAALRDIESMQYARAQSQASVDQLSSVLSDSQRQLRETRIFSPIDGVITKKLIQEGELVAALSGFSAGTAIVRIEDRTALMVKLSINEIDVAKLRVGMQAKVEVDAFPNLALEGTVRKIAPASINLTSVTPVSDNVVKYTVEIWLEKPDRQLRSGMSAKCTLEVIRRDKVLTLPLEYVGKDDKGSFVMIAAADKKGSPTRKDITVGISSGSVVEVSGAIKEGESVAKPEYKGPPRKGMMEVGRGDRD